MLTAVWQRLSRAWLYNPTDHSPPGSSVLGTLQAGTGAGCPFLLQGIFPTQGLSPDLLLCRQILYWATKGSPVNCRGLITKHFCFPNYFCVQTFYKCTAFAVSKNTFLNIYTVKFSEMATVPVMLKNILSCLPATIKFDKITHCPSLLLNLTWFRSMRWMREFLGRMFPHW